MIFTPFRSVPSRRAGFTLVELLVVIGIIAILAATTLQVGSSVINSAKRAKENSTATQIQTAVLAYYTEYSTYPVIVNPAPTTDTFVSTQADWKIMAVILAGGVDPGGSTSTQVYSSAPGNSNTRQIAFLTFNKGDLDTSVTPNVPKCPFKDTSNNTLYYQMAIDTDYSNVIGDTGTAPPDFSGTLSTLTTTAYASGNITGNTKAIQGGVAVWACGDPKTTTSATNPKLWVKTF